jgi:hypothetical protein
MQKYWARLQKLFIRAAVRWALQKHPKVAFLAAIVTAIALAGLWHISQAGHYRLSLAEQKLLAAPSVEKSKVVFKNGGLAYQTGAAKASRQLTVAGATDATGKDGYSAQLPADPKKGLQFSAAGSDLPVKLIPLDQMGGGKYIDGHYVYPSPGGKSIYTLRKNGVKEDIVLSKAPGDTLKYSWKLELGSQLEAKLMPNGTVGIYSANPLLSDSNLKISDAKSQQLIDNARKNGKKDNLVYVIPAPLLKDAGGKESNSGVKFNLSDNILTLTATNLKTKNYPLSIDPTIVVTTSADFATGYDDGNINYATANEINRGNISLGTVSGTWSSTSTFTQARHSHTSVAYNGYLYVIGGVSSSSANDCTAINNECNGVQYAPINANGTIGSWSSTTAFTQARHSHTSVAYNGYLYVIGGVSSSSANDCTATSNYCNGVQYNSINTGTPSFGTLGTWSSINTITTARDHHTSVAYNGYLYIIGGTNGSFQNNVLYATINSDGTVGTWNTATNAFNVARKSHTSVVYNGYLYVIGGRQLNPATSCKPVGDTSSQICRDIQYALICTGSNSGSGGCDSTAGNIGTWNTNSNTFTTTRYGHTSVAYNGYLYVMGGCTDTNCTTILSDIQYAPISSDGSVGVWNTTNSIITARYGPTSVAYNGYLYVIGGCSAGVGCSAFQNDVQYALICTGSNNGSAGCGATAGTVGTWNTTNTFTTARFGHTSVAYNGYLYVINGEDLSGRINDVQIARYSGPEQAATYEKTLDFGSLAKINSIIFNGIAPPLCGAGLVYPLINYKLAGTNGVYGSTSQITAAAGSTYNINKMGFRYMQIQFKLDDSYCGGTSKITDFTVDYQTAPDTPELILPSSGATAISGMPVFQLRSAGPNLNYLRYNVKVYTVQASCDSDSATDLIRDADQTSSQTGWNGQDQQTNTAYANSTTVTSSTIASYLYQLPGLVPGSTYWWKGRAIDPGNTNTWGNWATCQSFTTTQPELRLQGGTDIRGGTKIGP